MNMPNDAGWQLLRSARRSLVIHVHRDGRVIVRAPLRMPRAVIEQFVQQKQGWVAEKLAELAAQPRLQVEPLPELPRAQAVAILMARSDVLLAKFGSAWRPTAWRFRRMKARWGSCNSRGEITLNTQLACLPEPLIDYVICHELAHLREMNHGPAFYAVQQQLNPHWRTHHAEMPAWSMRLRASS